jgi:hypothetical protein
MHDANYNNNKKIKLKGRRTFGFQLQRCRDEAGVPNLKRQNP